MPDQIDPLLDRIGRSSSRMRIAMAITAALCLLITAGIATDRTLYTGGWGWRIGGILGVVFFSGMAVLLLYGVFWRQQRHIARLRTALREHPHTIRSIRLLVARAVPVASWSPDDGSARAGLHVIIEDDAGRTWLLPVSRGEAAAVLAELYRRCPQATTAPG